MFFKTIIYLSSPSSVDTTSFLFKLRQFVVQLVCLIITLEWSLCFVFKSILTHLFLTDGSRPNGRDLKLKKKENYICLEHFPLSRQSIYIVVRSKNVWRCIQGRSKSIFLSHKRVFISLLMYLETYVLQWECSGLY